MHIFYNSVAFSTESKASFIRRVLQTLTRSREKTKGRNLYPLLLTTEKFLTHFWHLMDDKVVRDGFHLMWPIKMSKVWKWNWHMWTWRFWLGHAHIPDIPTHITQWTPPCIVIDQTKEKLLESCQNWNWNFNFLSDLLFMKSTWIPLQDLQAQHATQKLREQSSLAKTDYTTHQVLNHLQYPCYKLLSCKMSYNILNLLAEETSRIHSHMPKLKRTESFLQVASQG